MPKVIYAKPLLNKGLQFYPSSTEFGYPVIVDTQTNILALTPTSGKLAYATDLLKFYLADGTNWYQIPLTLAIDLQAPDMGYTQDSAKTGYGTTYITDKSLNNITVGSNGTASTGGLKVTTGGQLQVYLNGVWNTIVNNFVFREDSSFGYTLEHQPVGFTNYIEIMTGETLGNLGLNGLPLTNGYKTVMGCMGIPATIGGRTII